MAGCKLYCQINLQTVAAGGVQVISQAVNLQRGPGLCRSRLTERPGRENFELFDNIGCIRSEGYGIIK